MINVFIVAEIIAISIIFLAMVLLATDGTGTKEQKLMCFFLSGVLVQNAGYLMELISPTVEAAIVSIKMQYLGSTFVPLCYCWFIYAYCYEKAPKKLLNVLGIVDLALLAIIFTLNRHNLYYNDIGWMTTGAGHSYLKLGHGPAYYVFLVCGCIIPYFLSFFTLFKSIKARPAYAASKKYKMITALSALPMIALLSYALNLTHVYDPTPAVLGIVLALVVILVWRMRTYDYRNMAADVLLENMGDGVIALDIQKRIISINQAAVRIFPELAGYKFGDSIEDLSNFPTSILDGETNNEFCVNERFYESHTKVILDKNKKNQGYVVLVIDVTDTRNYIEEIKRVREQAERANMAKSEFLANMSHEIRTPMNAITGLSDIIMEESLGLKLYDYASDIKSASQNLLAIINDILDLSKVEAGKMELVMSDYHVNDIVGEVVHMMDIAASQKGILMKYEYDPSIPCRYNGDEGRIKQILINLLNNAVKFTKQGYVKVTLSGTPGDNGDEEILVFKVEDTGCGIREEDREKIFENFKQVDSKRNRSVEGTGLGLSITRHLVLLMKGVIELDSVYGEGSTFTVKIPQKIVDRHTLAEVPNAPAAEAYKFEPFIAEGYKVLVVDDNRINRKVAANFLDTYKFDLMEAESGFEAVELVKKNLYDIIFMDHMMPEMDGIEAVGIIRTECGENGTSPIIIALTANAMEGVKERFLNSGFQDFLAKPLDRKHLNEVLLKWVPKDRRRARTAEDDDKALNTKNRTVDDISIAGIDIEAVKKYQSDSVSDYIELLKLYCMDGRRKIALLRKLYDEKNYKNYGIEVHGLKSASANIGAMKLSALAKEHEAAADRGDTEYIAKHFMELMAEYVEQLKNIQSFLDQDTSDSDESKAELLPIDREELIKEVSEALKQLESFHSKDCAARIENIMQHKLDSDTEAKLAEIQGQLKLYEDTLAEELLRQLIEEIGRKE